ncbi:hypothetical protein CC86DRAFT_248850, partial [Ophiobolus disseminans]
FHRFMELPEETRLIIWDLAIHDQPYTSPAGSSERYLCTTIKLREYVSAKDDPIRPRFLPPICLTSEKTTEKTIAVLIEGSTFMVASIHDKNFLQAFLKAAPGRLSLCRQLNFDYFGRFPKGYEKNADLGLAAQCSGLHTIKLTFHYASLTYKVASGDYEDGLTSVPCSAEDLFERFRLARLLDCQELKVIIIEHTDYYIEAAIQAAESLGQMI